MNHILKQKRILVGFVVNALVVVLFWQMAERRMKNQDRLLKAEMRRNEISERLGKIRSDVNRFGSSIKGYAISGNEKFLEYLNSESIYRNILFLRRSYFNDSIQLLRLNTLAQNVGERIETNYNILHALKDKDESRVRELMDLNVRQISQTQRILSEIEDSEDGFIRKANADIRQKEANLRLVYQICFVLALALLVLVFFIIHHHLRARLKSELLLNTNKQLLQSIIDNTSSLVFVKHINGEYLLANKQFKKIFQLLDEDITGKTDRQIFSEELATRFRESDGDVVKAGKEVIIEEVIPHFGQNLTFRLVKFPLLDANGKVYAIAGMATDISGQKSQGELLQQDIAQFQSLFDAAPAAMIVVDEQSRILKWNTRAQQLFKYSAQEVNGRSLPELILPFRFREQYFNAIEGLLETGSVPDDAHFNTELHVIDKDKREIEAEFNLSKARLNHRHLFIAFITDITRRRELEKESLETRNFLDSIIENIPDMIFVKDAKDLRFVRFNKAGENLLGIPRKELIGKNDYDFFPKEEADAFTGKDKEVLRSKSLQDIPEEQIETKNGKRWLHTKKIPILDEKGEPQYLLGISEDITERKRLETERIEAEKQLRTSEIQLGLILENIGEGVVVTDTRRRVVLSNQMAEEILETSRLRTTDWSKRYDIYYPDGQTVFPAQELPIEKALKGGDTEETEIILHDPETNNTKLVQVTGHPIRDEDNSIIAAVATIKDITKYKQLEKALEESEIKYRKLIGFRRDPEKE